ncbi:translation initiation factor 2 [Streptomyces sp. NPDC127098]|uniref:translation initiation factor 2 n=1 Tax=Streptomyces sp. NPDC127098 TaxID=3347137 RepID=UPI0036575DA4
MDTWATGDGRRATGDRRQATRRSVLFAARSAVALHRLLDVLPVFEGDDRVERYFTLVPGSEFGIGALAAVGRAGGRTIPWDEARGRAFDLVVAASPKGELSELHGPLVLLPHGAGYGKAFPGEGSGGAPSGLDRTYLTSRGRPIAALHALAHPSQVDRLAVESRAAATVTTVTGDPTLERILESAVLRPRFRAALGTGGRRLVVITSTWGPESLLRRRPSLPAELLATLPYDAYQLALVAHPNEHSERGALQFAEPLRPALDAGLVLAEPHEEWASVLVAADVVITDHGSTALYAAALDRPVIAAYDGGQELIPGSPTAELLAGSLRFAGPDSVGAALAGHRPGAARARTGLAFAHHHEALARLRASVYPLLGLDPPAWPAVPRLLPVPARPAGGPGAFAVRTRISGTEVRVERFPDRVGPDGHFLAAESGLAGRRHEETAGLLYRRSPGEPAPHAEGRSAERWLLDTLADHPSCRTAGIVLSPELCLLAFRSGPPLAARIEQSRQDGTAYLPDPAAVLCALHTWRPAPPTEFTCVTADRATRVRLAPATPAELARTVWAGP